MIAHDCQIHDQVFQIKPYSQNATKIHPFMTASILSTKISICEQIEAITDDDCGRALDIIQDFLCCSNRKELLIKIVMQGDRMIGNSSYKKINESFEKSFSPVINPQQLALPIDCIRNVSFYLNEFEIIRFERVCRLFYKMINDRVYLI